MTTIRNDARMGQFLKWYESARYTPVERRGVPTITVPIEAEEFADGSFYQAGMNWTEYAKHARAVILRVGQNEWKDLEFETFYAAAHRVGLLVGGYFFYDGRATPEKQAAVIIAAMQGKYFEMELFIDWEHNYGGQYEGLPNVVSLMQKVEAAGVKCKAVGLYTGYYFFVESSNATTNAAQYTYLKQRPLWLAWYASASIVKVPAPWTNWTHWQYGTPTVSWGQPTAELDMNRHNGTREQFAARYMVGEIFPPEDGEPIMQWYEVKTAKLNIRSVPGMNSYGQAIGVDIGDLFLGDKIETNERSGDWVRITQIQRAAWPTPEPLVVDSWCLSTYCVPITAPPVVLPTGLPDEFYMGLKADGSDRKLYRKVV
jgi:GH25 family lysozyme M1 (1,4-beta-N-acetylmuramidase)